jgi:hypothetical protein
MPKDVLTTNLADYDDFTRPRGHFSASRTASGVRTGGQLLRSKDHLRCKSTSTMRFKPVFRSDDRSSSISDLCSDAGQKGSHVLKVGGSISFGKALGLFKIQISDEVKSLRKMIIDY